MNMDSRVAFVEHKMPPSRQQIVPIHNTLFKRDNWPRNLTKNKSPLKDFSFLVECPNYLRFPKL